MLQEIYYEPNLAGSNINPYVSGNTTDSNLNISQGCVTASPSIQKIKINGIELELEGDVAIEEIKVDGKKIKLILKPSYKYYYTFPSPPPYPYQDPITTTTPCYNGNIPSWVCYT